MAKMKLLDEYLDLQQKICDYFGYAEEWPVFPIDDARKYYWMLVNNDDYVLSSEYPLTPKRAQCGDFTVEYIYTRVCLEQYVFRADDYTMIVVDTGADVDTGSNANTLLSIFDNSKEITDPSDELLDALEGWI
jgi:hypothetical protein